MSAEESKHQIDWAERDLAIILTLLWQCLRSAPQRRAELGRHRTTPGVGIPAAARRSHRDLAASRRDPHYRKRPRPAHGLGAWRSVPGGEAAPLARTISRRTAICATTRRSSHQCCWALAWTSAFNDEAIAVCRRDIRVCQSEWERSSSVCGLIRQPYHRAVTLAAIWSAIFCAESEGLALHVLMSMMTLFLSASARPQPQPGAPAVC